VGIGEERTARARIRATAARSPSSPYAARAVAEARDLVRDPQRLLDLVRRATRKADQPPTERMGEAREELKALIRLATAYVRGDYRAVSRDNLVRIVGALVYFVSPLDLVPDFLTPFGFSDDAVVVAFVLRKVREELHSFLAWEAEQEERGLQAGEAG